MKTLRITFFALLIVFGVTQLSFGQIKNSDHDFSGSGWSGGQICLPCHTPHNANVTVSGTPLWNHAVTTATYTAYASATISATMGQPSASSKLCLSCHDGTVAIDSYGNSTGTTKLTGGANLGSDLKKHHPISFTYDAALATLDGGLFNPTSTNSGLGGTITNDLLLAGSMECASCHDVHNGAGISKLLRKSNQGSALCLTCHNK